MRSNYSVPIDGIVLDWVNSVKGLGVVSDRNLCFNKHFHEVYKTTYGLRDLLEENVQLELVKASIYPYIYRFLFPSLPSY